MNHFLLIPTPTGREFGSSDWLIGLESDGPTFLVDSGFEFEAATLANGPGLADPAAAGPARAFPAAPQPLHVASSQGYSENLPGDAGMTDLALLLARSEPASSMAGESQADPISPMAPSPVDVAAFAGSGGPGGPGLYKLLITGVYGLSGTGEFEADPGFVGTDDPVALTGVANLMAVCLEF